ncbi:nuclear transport factor 2 family protein [Streptomyces iconiensis]|uniref:Nuclear transport factor 2 family protein n=1 Tax=Streptomyces iconiensis TaxID=1384038 RepID=A0ABT7A488_9ACTN|nr:nuclear transport factor 2 family protein [Streptomyces iconiensis]MDJ1135849.1 nuclear transport factor 2 family protein [Streptomyces iconiensis]
MPDRTPHTETAVSGTPAASSASAAPTGPEGTESPESPEGVFRRGLQFLLDKDIAGWVALWHEDGVIEFPFAPEGAPRRLEGKERIADYMGDYPDLLDVRAFPEVTVHRTAAAETIVVEMRAEGFVVATGEPYEMTYICVVTVSEGRFAHYRDYWSPHGAPVSLSVTELTDTEAAR